MTSTGTWCVLSEDTYAYGDSNWKDKLTAYKGQSFNYDAIGNPLTWQHGRQLQSYNKNGSSSRYRYDEDGNRMSKQTGDTLTRYYLNSRYYDPVVGRFLNADGNVSTGQGALGYNRFAYCNNNPISRQDSSGKFWGIALGLAIAAVLFGCGIPTRQEIRNAKRLDRSRANKRNYNCYGNAIGKEIRANPVGYKTGDSSESVFKYVQEDVGKRNVRRLVSINDEIDVTENLVALKCGPTDFHFMVRVDGIWYSKSGTEDLLSGEIIEQAVQEDIWTAMYINDGIVKSSNEYVYDDQTIYFAIKKEWDDN